jgi:homospermidine synthase
MAKKTRTKKTKGATRNAKLRHTPATDVEAQLIKEREDKLEAEHPTIQAHADMMDAIEDVSRLMKQAGVRSVHIEDGMACITETMHVCLENGHD